MGAPSRDPVGSWSLAGTWELLPPDGGRARRVQVPACWEDAGIARERIILDPGLGFGKLAAHSLDVLQHLALLRTLGCPVLLGASRKSMIAKVSGQKDLPPAERLPGSLALAQAGVARGASIVRVHDVAETRQALALAQAVESAP